jgi:3-hydroxy-3-methylglutaryl CoA synthase
MNGEQAGQHTMLLLQELFRRPHAAISAIAFYVGEHMIKSEELVKTIKNLSTEQEINDEASKVRYGLGMSSNSVGNVGETAITSAALAVVRLALAYNFNLSEFDGVEYHTETPNSIAANNARAVMRAVNRFSKKLDEISIHIGRLHEVKEPSSHSQDACHSGVASLTRIARLGHVAGKKLVIMSDKAGYQFGTPPTETGGDGAIVFVVEEVIGKKGLALLPLTGAFGEDYPDFDKLLVSRHDTEITGQGNVSKLPIVFGMPSQFEYIFDTYKALKIVAAEAKIDMTNPKFLDDYVIIGHVPYPGMVKKAYANLLVHFMRYDNALKEKVLLEAGLSKDYALPVLNGLESQERSFEFVHDVTKLVLKLEQQRELIKRGETQQIELIRDNSREIAAYEIDMLDELIAKYNIKRGSDIRRVFAETEKKLKKIAVQGGDLEELIGAFSTLYEYDDERPKENKSQAYVNLYMQDEINFSSRLRKTATYRELAKTGNLDEVLKLPSENANLYTGSAPLSLISYLVFADENTVARKKIILVGYGSGAGSSALIVEPEEVMGMRRVLTRMLHFDEQIRKSLLPEGQNGYITADEYKTARLEKRLSRFIGKEAPLITDVLNGDFHINKERAQKYATEFVEYVRAEKLEAVARTAQTVARAKLRVQAG